MDSVNKEKKATNEKPEDLPTVVRLLGERPMGMARSGGCQPRAWYSFGSFG
jgi:hypothetical protein